MDEEVLQEVRLLARQVGVAEERLDLLLLQAQQGDQDEEQNGGPLILLASAGEGTLELFLSRWLGEEFAEAVQRAGFTPLVAGPNPEELCRRPGQTGWASLQTDKFKARSGHFVILTSAGALPARLEGSLATFGRWDLVVVVTRASMALPQSERELLKSLSKFVAIAKVLVVAVPRELDDNAEAVKVENYVQGKAETFGFEGGRYGGVRFWCLDGCVRHPSGVADPGELFVTDPQAVARARDAMLKSKLAEFVKEIEKKEKTSVAKNFVELSDEELKRILDDFSRLMAGVKRKAEKEFQGAVGATDEALRNFVLDEILGWTKGDSIGGIWTTYLENVRPGAKGGFFNLVKEQVKLLTLRARGKAKGEKVEYPEGKMESPSGLPYRFTEHPLAQTALRIGFAMFCGVILWAVASVISRADLVAACAAAIGGIIGFTSYGFVFETFQHSVSRKKAREVKHQELSPSEDQDGGVVRGFNIFEDKLTEWLNQYVNTQRIDVAGRCKALLQTIDPAA